MSAAQDMPVQIAALPRDAHGRPIPWFADYDDTGVVVDYRHAAPNKLDRAIAGRRCWICGRRLTGLSAFLVGPSGAFERISCWPPSHLDCVQFAVRDGCPFFRDARASMPLLGLPQSEAATRLELVRGLVVLWVTPDHAVSADDNGPIFLLGEPSMVVWLREGRPATRAEANDAVIAAAIEAGRLARRPGGKGEQEVGIKLRRALAWLPPAADGTPPTNDPETESFQPQSKE